MTSLGKSFDRKLTIIDIEIWELADVGSQGRRGFNLLENR